jgi:ABC-type dipeptide/oligopeptide/nickel transport system permease component
MARFDGIKQGLAVWGWSIVIAIVIAVLGAVFGNEYAGIQGLPDVTFDETTTTVVVSIAVVLLTSLVGAMLGGLAGMRFHRRVDRTGLGR